MKSPSAFFMMLALCNAVTVWRLLSRAYWNAYSATRVLAFRVMIWTQRQGSSQSVKLVDEQMVS